MQYQKEQVILKAINDGGSATFASVVALVSHDMYKTNNPLRKAVVTKRVKYNVTLNANYQNAVNAKRKREGKEADFIASSAWHEKVYDSYNGAIVRNKKDHASTYLSVIVNDATVYDWYVDGRAATQEEIDIAKHFKVIKKAKKQELDDDVIFRTIKIGGIEQINVNGVRIGFKG